MKRKFTFLSSVSLIGPIAVALATPAWASSDDTVTGSNVAETQTAPDVTSGESADETGASASSLQEIIVTAQRREENLQRAAIAISVVTGGDLARQGISQPNQLQAVVPSLQTRTGGSYSNFFIRGVGATVTNGYTDPAVAFNYDGIYISRPSALNGYFYDVQRVEVLKGPQGTLYGRNATGGAVNVLSNLPKLGELSGSLTGEVGNYDLVHVDGHINVPIGNNSALRLSSNWINRSGYYRDGTGDEVSRAARLQFLTEPTEDLKIRLSTDYYHQGGNGQGSTISTVINPVTSNGVVTGYSYDPTNLAPNTGIRSRETQAILGTRFLLPTRVFNPAEPDYNTLDNTFWGVNAQVDWRTPIGTLTVLPAYRRSKLNIRETDGGNPTRINELSKQTSLELRLASDSDGPLKYLAGLYYLKEDIDARYIFNFRNVSPYQDLKTGVKSYAAFGRLTYELSDSFRLTGGLRYTNDKRYMDGDGLVLVAICTEPGTAPCANGVAVPIFENLSDLGISQPYAPTPIPGTSTVLLPKLNSVNGKSSESAVTWRVGAEWDIGPRSLLYASYETGFRSGGFFFTADDPTFKPEKIGALTIGSKNRFFDNRLQLNVELFYWKYRDQQVSHISTDSTGGSVFITENVGRSTNKGFEVETRFLPFKNTLLSADVQYLDAKFNEFTYNAPNSGSPPVNGCASSLASNSVTYLIDCSGGAPLRAPKWSMNFGIEQTIALMNGADLVANLSTHYQTSSLVGTEFIAAEMQKSYWMSNASITYKSSEGNWSLTAFLNNIENTYVSNSIRLNSSNKILSTSYMPPRTYGLRATVSF
ncbi:TonB-dependent receptor [Novosphingobium pentaromativorans]|uniref:TonB-dependent receptor n=1 Tax=Novosphingobium pentaromativorans US6-1 TaxID=1088721 RepID=G6EFN8_9SPHN|nr:TonB-dependent receptor [Novosphingobium pentaromativorans]AIT81834.1 hypothetical protein JI59_19780 [Novosphingobium pentaromativorans US6-1]EHJ59909.1 hypothetical protein NSU_3159 [Novosphingobium pentaromativorans US6-1]